MSDEPANSAGDRPDVLPDGAAHTRRRRIRYYIPLLLFAVLAGLFLSQLGGDPSKLPSALIGRPVPDFELPALAGGPDSDGDAAGLSSDDLRSGVSVVNIWASWCGPCRTEHPILMALSQRPGFVMAGINYKDEPDNARRFLGVLGNPYDLIGADRSGRSSIDWGVYGVPETFIVKDGVIVHKHIGPLSEAAMAATFEAALDAALKSSGP